MKYFFETVGIATTIVYSFLIIMGLFTVIKSFAVYMLKMLIIKKISIEKIKLDCKFFIFILLLWYK